MFKKGKRYPEGEQAHEEPVEQAIHDQFQNNKQDLPVEAQQLVQLRHNGRVICKPTRYVLLSESYQVITNDSEDDPINYNEGLEDVDA